MLKLLELSTAIQILVEAAVRQRWQRRQAEESSPDREVSAESDIERHLLRLTLK